jgi:tetratricopeptide (TPR) repeat protein
VGNEDGASTAYRTLGLVHASVNRHEQAIDCYRQSILIERRLGAKYWEAVALDALGDAHAAVHQHKQAQDAWRRSLTILVTMAPGEAQPIQVKLRTLA